MEQLIPGLCVDVSDVPNGIYFFVESIAGRRCPFGLENVRIVGGACIREVYPPTQDGRQDSWVFKTGLTEVGRVGDFRGKEQFLLQGDLDATGCLSIVLASPDGLLSAEGTD